MSGDPLVESQAGAYAPAETRLNGTETNLQLAGVVSRSIGVGGVMVSPASFASIT